MKVIVSHKVDLVITLESDKLDKNYKRRTVEFTFPKVSDTEQLKSLIKTAQKSGKKDNLFFSWLSVYFLIYGKMPTRYRLVVFDVIRQIPLSKLFYLPSVFTSLDKIAEVI